MIPAFLQRSCTITHPSKLFPVTGSNADKLNMPVCRVLQAAADAGGGKATEVVLHALLLEQRHELAHHLPAR